MALVIKEIEENVICDLIIVFRIARRHGLYRFQLFISNNQVGSIPIPQSTPWQHAIPSNSYDPMHHALFEAREQDIGDQRRQPHYHNPVVPLFSFPLNVEGDELSGTSQ